MGQLTGRKGGQGRVTKGREDGFVGWPKRPRGKKVHRRKGGWVGRLTLRQGWGGQGNGDKASVLGFLLTDASCNQMTGVLLEPRTPARPRGHNSARAVCLSYKRTPTPFAELIPPPALLSISTIHHCNFPNHCPKLGFFWCSTSSVLREP